MESETNSIAIEDADDFLLDFKELNDIEYGIPTVVPPSLDTVLWELESEEGSDNSSLYSLQSLSQKSRSMLYHGVLQGISSQLASAAERVNAGLPCVITNSVKLVAIGSSHGFVFAYDSEQKLCWCHHETSFSEQGAISALAFNMDSTRLLVGYERGYITMINALNGDVIRKLPDAHAPQSAVLNIRYTQLNNLALCSDSAGCVFSLTFNRRLGVRVWDSKCLFSGARGEVCTFEPLIDNFENHLLGQSVIVAMATLSKVIVITIKPHLKILFTQQLPKISTTLPLLSWQIVSVGKLLQPVLAWGRNTELNYTRVVTGLNNKLRLSPLRSIQLSYSLCVLHWLGPKHLAIFDTNENLRLIEVRTQKEVEFIELTSVGLVYSSAHFKALALGGGVSEAFALAGEHACYNSISSRGSQMLILGTKTVHIIKLRTWAERINYLSEQGRWAEALNLAAEEGVYREKTTTVLFENFLSCMKNGIDRESLTAAVNCCVKLKKIDILCNDLWETVSTDQCTLQWYYNMLTEHICNGNLYFLNPSVAQELVKYLEIKNLQLLENVLLSVDLSCLDLHQVLNICKKRNLYDPWIHITTKSMGDYVSPITEFVTELKIDNHKLGNTLLVYVSACLSGLGYPHGKIPEHEIPRIKHDILRCLETIHSINHGENEPTYPYLRALLKYNTRECLNVVDLSFKEAEFCGEMGLLQRQRLVKILLQVVQFPEFNSSQVINLTCFISRLITSNNLNIEEDVLNVLSTNLMTINAKLLTLRDHMEREQAWIDLLNQNKVKHVDIEEALQMALQSKCYKVAENIYERKKCFSNILYCYLKDNLRHSEIFTYIAKNINDEERDIRQQFIDNFKILVNINSSKTADIVMEYFPEQIQYFCEIAAQDSEILYKFVSEIISTEIKLSPNIAEEYLKLLCIKNSSAVYNYIKLNLCRVEKALKITQQYQIHEASGFLLEQNGNFQEALDLFLENKMTDAAVKVCIRSSEHLDARESQEVWLKLLKYPNCIEGISMRELLHAAAPNVPPSQLLELMSHANLGDIKSLISGMLADCHYDMQMLNATLKILDHDLHHGLAKALCLQSKAISVQTNRCVTCQKLLSRTKENDEQIIVWGCGHCFHSDCIQNLDQNKNCPQCKIPSLFILQNKINSKKNFVENSDSFRLRPDVEGHF